MDASMTAETSNARGWVDALLGDWEKGALVNRLTEGERAVLRNCTAALRAAAPPQPAVPYDRELIARMLEAARRGALHQFSVESVERACQQLRAADNASAGAETVSRPPAAARVDVRGLVALAEQWERDAGGCRRDGYIDAAAVKEDCAFRLRQALGIRAIAAALSQQPEPKAEARGVVDRAMVRRALSAEYAGHGSVRDALATGTDWAEEMVEVALTAALTGDRNG